MLKEEEGKKIKAERGASLNTLSHTVLLISEQKSPLSSVGISA